jgi:hypothetical protein
MEEDENERTQDNHNNDFPGDIFYLRFQNVGKKGAKIG